MRLSEETARVIVETAVHQFGTGVQMWLFGSRVRDSVRGGDFDVLAASPSSPASPAQMAAEHATALQWNLGDQRIDIVVDDGSGALPIVARARETGRRLM